MARHTRNARRPNPPVAIAATRTMPRGNKLAMVGLACVTLAASLFSPLLALGLVGLMLYQAFGARR